MISLIFCVASILRVYSLPGRNRDHRGAMDACGTWLYVGGILTVCIAVFYHIMQECRGHLDRKRVIGYDIIFVLSAVFILVVSATAHSDNIDSSSTIKSIIYLIRVSTFQNILLCVAITHEFKWVSSFFHAIHLPFTYLHWIGIFWCYISSVHEGTADSICWS